MSHVFIFFMHINYMKPEKLKVMFYSFIRDISIAPLQVHYYSEALPTTAMIRLSATGNCE